MRSERTTAISCSTARGLLPKADAINRVRLAAFGALFGVTDRSRSYTEKKFKSRLVRSARC